MPGEIKHYWVGTTLMVESDAGVSGCDLKGQTGDIGPRGPQGPAGVVVGDGGNLNVDLTGYATETYVDNAIANAELGGGDVDLSNYATKDYVSAEIAKAELSGGDVDLSGYATKDDLTGLATEDYVDNAVANVDLTDYAKKVYVEAAIDNRILFGTSDKTPGISALSHGRFYFVYE